MLQFFDNIIGLIHAPKMAKKTKMRYKMTSYQCDVKKFALCDKIMIMIKRWSESFNSILSLHQKILVILFMKFRCMANNF